MKIKKWNKKGNIFLGLVVAIIIWFYGILFLPFIADTIVGSRIDLSCASSTTITSGTMMTCLLFSGIVPYFLWFIISCAIGYLISGGKQ